MKMMKKLAVVLLSICLCMPCFSMVAEAADGRISFSDPETAVGEVFELKCVARSTSGSMKEVKIDLSYDSSALRFQSGDNVSANGDGALTCASSESSSEITFMIKFQALTEGSTKVTVNSASISDKNGATLTLDQGSSTVKIAAGDPSKIVDVATPTSASDMQVEVNGVSYTLTDNFADADIPNGYSRTQVQLDGQDRQMIMNESGTICLAYLTSAEGTGDFYLYNAEDATFAPFEEIPVSDMTTIIVLSDTSKVDLPDAFQQATLTLNDKEFPVWQDTEHDGYYVLYAMNNNGEAGYYRYDSVEGTYQRFQPEAEVAEEEEVDSSSLLGKIQNFVEKNLAMVVLVGGLGGILLILILIIVSVKLHNRNAELDELYDEYGIDLDEEEEVAPKKNDKKAKKDKKSSKKYDDFDDFDDFEDFTDDEFADAEEEFEDEFEDDLGLGLGFETEEFPTADFDDFAEEDLFDTVPMIKPAAKAPKAKPAAKQAVKPAAKPAAKQPVSKPVKSAKPAAKPRVSKPEFEENVFAGYDTRTEITIDDLDALLSGREETPSRRGHFDTDDTFQMDFIDLD